MHFFAGQDLTIWEAVKDCGITHVPMAIGMTNLGDDIQTLAALRWLGLPETAASVVQRDVPHSWPINSTVLLCGWYARCPDLGASRVIVCGMHLNAHLLSDDIASGRLSRLGNAVRRQGVPAGARDLHTQRVLKAHGIDAVWSGCPTQTLRKPEPRRTESGLQLAIDTPCPGADWTPVTHRMAELHEATVTQRLDQAAWAIERLERAQRVVTSRLHAWLPALALWVPEVSLHFPTRPTNAERWSGFPAHLPGESKWTRHTPELPPLTAQPQ